jgi:hypothetical protein
MHRVTLRATARRPTSSLLPTRRGWRQRAIQARTGPIRSRRLAAAPAAPSRGLVAAAAILTVTSAPLIAVAPPGAARLVLLATRTTAPRTARSPLPMALDAASTGASGRAHSVPSMALAPPAAVASVVTAMPVAPMVQSAAAAPLATPVKTELAAPPAARATMVQSAAAAPLATPLNTVLDFAPLAPRTTLVQSAVAAPGRDVRGEYLARFIVVDGAMRCHKVSLRELFGESVPATLDQAFALITTGPVLCDDAYVALDLLLKHASVGDVFDGASQLAAGFALRRFVLEG